MAKNYENNYQDFTIWFCKKTILKKRIFKNLHLLFSIFKISLLSTIKITAKNR